MIIRKTVSADREGISQITQFVREQLQGSGIREKDVSNACLAAEEMAGSIASHATGDMTVAIRGVMGYLTVEISAKGDRYNPAEKIGPENLLDEEVGAGAQDTIRSILLRSMAEKLRYRHNHGTNRISFLVRRSKHAFLYQTLGAMALAVIAGFLLSELGFADLNTDLDTYLLTPVKTMYLNALKMIVAPVVFFSIVSCIVRFSDLSELGRVGGRTVLMYMITTVIAVFVGIGCFYLFKPGGAIPAGAVSDAVKDITSKTMDVSIKDMIVGIVPSDFLQPFVESDMLQLIFLAVICGIGAGLMGHSSERIKDMFESLNELFLKITSLVIRFMPIAVFCSICSMMLNMGIATIISVFGIFATFVFGLLCMMLIYSIIMMVVAKLNPLPFLKKYPQTMLQVFSMASSNASIPLNMEACKNLGIAQKIYSLSIPLGATVNMDGACVYMAVFALSLAKIYGVPVTGASLTAMIISIIVLSVGAPGIPGSGLICLSVLLAQIGVPTEAIGLIMGIDSLVGMFRCMSNCTGDVAVSVAVAKREHMLDENVYRK
ncbi:MAG: cation:dicarboxylase symporter family transporter [Lachnospiraceae bacterium]|nr:cation:dicarboxylase symporter family transporter [Lachnospiraceae bacterium]